MSADAPARISVSEDRLRTILAEFKLELFEKLREYATQASVDVLAASVRTRLEDHDARLRGHDGRVQTLEDKRVTREEFHSLKSEDARLELLIRGRPEEHDFEGLRNEIESLKIWRAAAKGALALIMFSLPVLAALSWHIWG